jgi:lipopolysaccharide export LptBFGC system permease protein LptF
MKGLPLWWIVSCFARLLPSFASLAVPMAFLVAAMMTLGHLADAGEVMALRSAGFSFYEIAKPFFWMAVALSALLLLINHEAGPTGFHSFRNETNAAGDKLAKIELRPGAFTPLGPWRLYARGADRRTGKLEGVYLVKPGEKESVRVNAEYGTIKLEPGRGVDLQLEDGELQLPNSDPTRYTSGRFEHYNVYLPLSNPPEQRDLDIQEMTTPQLRARAADSSVPHDRRLEYVVETAARSSGALSPVIFFFIAVPLGLGLKKRARGADFAASLGVMFAFYGLLVVGISLGRRHDLLAPTAPWLADVVGLTIGAWLTKRAATQ